MKAPTQQQLSESACWDSAPEWATHYCVLAKAFHNCSRNDHCCIPRPTKPQAPEWDGGGLPPVGAPVRCQMDAMRWVDGRVVGHDEEGGIPAAVCRVLDSYYAFSGKCLRPIRTKKQRDGEEMAQLLRRSTALGPLWCEDVAADIIAEGWRKGD